MCRNTAGIDPAHYFSAIPVVVPVLSPSTSQKQTPPSSPLICILCKPLCLDTVVMAFQLLFASAATTLLIIVSILIMGRLRISQSLQAAKKHDYLDLTSGLPEPTMLSNSIALALPDSVIFPHDAAAFKRSMNSYWAQQECEVIPACVVRPRDVQQLCTAVTVIKRQYDDQRKQAGADKGAGLFAIRSGGHSPVSGAASIKGGVLIDLGLFREVIPSDDGSSVTIGAGAKWMDVSKVLDERGLAVVGGRNSAVGVGGLTLGGELRLVMSTLARSLLQWRVRSLSCRLQPLHSTTSTLTEA